jgi:hypothetical protein
MPITTFNSFTDGLAPNRRSREHFITNINLEDDRRWVPYAEGVWIQPCHFNVTSGGFSVVLKGLPGGVSPRPRQTRNKAGGYCITPEHHDGDRGCRVFGGLDPLVASDENRIYLESHKVSSEFWIPLEFSLVVPNLEDEILPFNVPTFAEAEPEGCLQVRSGRGRGADPADSIDLFRLLLRFHGNRCKEQAECENDREPDQAHGHLRGNIRAQVDGQQPTVARRWV